MMTAISTRNVPGQNCLPTNLAGCCRRTNRFPSAVGGEGFKPLADKIHELGLKFGFHMMRGIPRQAVHCPRRRLKAAHSPLLMRGTRTTIAAGVRTCSACRQRGGPGVV